MIRVHLHTLHGGRVGIDQIPVFASIGAAPQTGGVRIHSLWIERIEGKKIHYAAQVEHAPGASAIICDVRTRHIARNQDRVGVMRAYGGIEHRTSPAGTNYTEVPRSLRKSGSQTREDEDCRNGSEFHKC